MTTVARIAFFFALAVGVARVAVASSLDDAGSPATPSPAGEGPVLRVEDKSLVVDLDPLLPEEWRAKDAKARKEGWSFVAFPNLRYNPDEGLGAGLSLYAALVDGQARPYKLYLGFRTMATLKLAQRHELIVDAVRIFDTRLRVDGRAGFYAVAYEPFCGIGPTASCDAGEASRAAGRLGLDDEERASFERTYFVMRMLRPYAWANLRYDLPLGLKLFAGGRLEYVWPGYFGEVLEGELFDAGPYPGSKLAALAPDGQEGVSHVVQAGLLLDTRDHEPDPTRGLFVEASLRGAHSLLGSSWDFVGANLGARAFAPLDKAERLVLASRVVVDATVGDVPVQELARIGGVQDIRAFGGVFVGRGMRQQRYIGQGKAFTQLELRWRALSLLAAGQHMGAELLGFYDAGAVVAETLRPFASPLHLASSGGVGLRLVFNRNIVLRFDLGFSREEGFVPAFYIDAGQTF